MIPARENYLNPGFTFYGSFHIYVLIFFRDIVFQIVLLSYPKIISQNLQTILERILTNKKEPMDYQSVGGKQSSGRNRPVCESLTEMNLPIKATVP
jgi:hypothetical protein